jgi:eukaryotic-like serine/threonine-protein kinase
VNLKGAVGDSVEDATIENGKVATQDQAANSEAKEGDTITYHLSSGVGSVEISDYSGSYYTTAQANLANAGFTNVTVNWVDNSSEDKGTVVSQSPNSGKVNKDTQITLNVSSGPKSSPVTTEPETQSSPTTSESEYDTDPGL